MAFAMLPSAIEAMLKLSQCSRRKQVTKATCVVSRESLLKYAACGRCDQGFKEAMDTTDKSVDNGEISTELSDSSEQVCASTDGSETDSPASNPCSPIELPSPPQWLENHSRFDFPPGLELPQSQPTSLKLDTAIVHGRNSRLNAKASRFVPSFAAAVPALTPEMSAESQNLIALGEALSRLTPKDTAMVRSLLESKEAAENVPTCMNTNLMHTWPQMPPMYPSSMLGAWAGNVGAAAMPMMPPGQFYEGQQPFCPLAARICPAGMRPLTSFQGSTCDGKPQAKMSKPENSVQEAMDDSLASHLRELAALDSGRVLMVRKINHLGSDAATLLKAYFAKFGTVDQVLMSATRSPAKPGRLRPATIGFFVMETTEVVQAILAHGAEHTLAGVTINVSAFESHSVHGKGDRANKVQ